MSITIPLSIEQTRQVSDGYHTFDELYEHRCLLFIKLCIHSGWKTAWKPHYPGWPVLFLETPGGQISYHFDEAKWGEMVAANIERDDSYEWDEHTSADVLARLRATWK